MYHLLWFSHSNRSSYCEWNIHCFAGRRPSLRLPWPSTVTSTPWSRGFRQRNMPGTWLRRTSSWSWAEAERRWRCSGPNTTWRQCSMTTKMCMYVCVCFQSLKGLCMDSKRSRILQRLELSLDILAGTVERISNTAEVLGAVHQVGC